MVVLSTCNLQSNSVSVPSQTDCAKDMSHWMHCNGCYCQPQSGVDLKFYLTNCSHLYCEKCVVSCAKERCKVCRSQCTTLVLAGKLPKEVENLFTDPIDLHQKFNKQFHQTLEFQKSHQRRLVRQMKEKMKFFGNQLGQFVEQVNALKRELQQTKAENEYLIMMLKKQDSHIRSGISPAQLYGSPYGTSQNFMTNAPAKYCSASGITNQPGRLLVRTPPSNGHLGTVGGMRYTPSDNEFPGDARTPLTVPRPIHFSKSN